MTEQTIRAMAKEFSGKYYESIHRTAAFREGKMLTKAVKAIHVKIGGITVVKEVEFNIPFRVAYPNVKAYVKSAWPHWVDHAREKLSEMLGMPDERISPLMKERIFAAILEDRENQLRHGAKRLRQIKGETDGSIGISEKLRQAQRRG